MKVMSRGLMFSKTLATRISSGKKLINVGSDDIEKPIGILGDKMKENIFTGIENAQGAFRSSSN